jgi:hypothetical protein
VQERERRSAQALTAICTSAEYCNYDSELLKLLEGNAVLQKRMPVRTRHQQKLYRVGPNCETWPNTLTENPY